MRFRGVDEKQHIAFQHIGVLDMANPNMHAISSVFRRTACSERTSCSLYFFSFHHF